MSNNILAFFAPGSILVILAFFGIPIVLIVVFLRLLLRNKKENIRLRLEVGKLAETYRKKGTQNDKYLVSVWDYWRNRSAHCSYCFCHNSCFGHIVFPTAVA